MAKLGHDFGSTPFGIHQILARLRARNGCTCDPRFIDIANDIDCPDHGLIQHLEKIAAERSAA